MENQGQVAGQFSFEIEATEISTLEIIHSVLDLRGSYTTQGDEPRRTVPNNVEGEAQMNHH